MSDVSFNGGNISPIKEEKNIDADINVSGAGIEPIDHDMFSMNNISAIVSSLSPKKLTSKSKFRPLVNVDPNKLSLKKLEKPSMINDESRYQTPSSIHLSEFEHPPQSTSTPYSNNYLDTFKLRSFNKRPTGYSDPLFRFKVDDYEKQKIHNYRQSKDLVSMNVSIQSNVSSSSALSPIPQDEDDEDDDVDDHFVDSYESPLAYKANRDTCESVKDEISHIVEKMRTDITMRNSISLMNEPDNDMISEEFDFSLQDVSSISMIDINDIQSTSTPQKSCLKKKNLHKSSSSSSSLKKVRIDEVVRLITTNDYTDSIKTIKRPISANVQAENKNRSKRSKLKHKVDPEISYESLLNLCGEDKDPIQLIKF